MKKELAISQEEFDRFLSWLHPNRDEAGKEYEKIRRELINMFTRRGCAEAEDLADITFNRVIKKVAKIADSYVGDRAPYFSGVAYYVRLEVFKKPPIPLPMPDPDPPDEKEMQQACLDMCLNQLPLETRQLFLQYYREQKATKIAHRKTLAEQERTNPNALRIRMHRIRTRLRECVMSCMEKSVVE